MQWPADCTAAAGPAAARPTLSTLQDLAWRTPQSGELAGNRLRRQWLRRRRSSGGVVWRYLWSDEATVTQSHCGCGAVRSRWEWEGGSGKTTAVRNWFLASHQAAGGAGGAAQLLLLSGSDFLICLVYGSVRKWSPGVRRNVRSCQELSGVDLLGCLRP